MNVFWFKIRNFIPNINQNRRLLKFFWWNFWFYACDQKLLLETFYVKSYLAQALEFSSAPQNSKIFELSISWRLVAIKSLILWSNAWLVAEIWTNEESACPAKTSVDLFINQKHSLKADFLINIAAEPLIILGGLWILKKNPFNLSYPI